MESAKTTWTVSPLTSHNPSQVWAQPTYSRKAKLPHVGVYSRAATHLNYAPPNSGRKAKTLRFLAELILAFAIVVAVGTAVLTSYAMVIKARAESLLKGVTALRVGTSTGTEARQLAERHKRYLWQVTAECNDDNCSRKFSIRNRWLSALRLGPEAQFQADVTVRNGTVDSIGAYLFREMPIFPTFNASAGLVSEHSYIPGASLCRAWWSPPSRRRWKNGHFLWTSWSEWSLVAEDSGNGTRENVSDCSRESVSHRELPTNSNVHVHLRNGHYVRDQRRQGPLRRNPEPCQASSHSSWRCSARLLPSLANSCSGMKQAPGAERQQTRRMS